MVDWRKLFVSLSNHSLEFFPSKIIDETSLVAPPEDVFEEGANEWKDLVIAQIMGNPPNFSLLQRTLSKLWENKGSVRINIVGPNLFVFQFENEQICNWILENCPCHIRHNPMILRKWEPNIGKINLALDKLPLWFHLHNVPLDLYSKRGISYIASAIEKPLYMDNITTTKKRLEYAKVCVEVSASDDPPEKINTIIRDGSIVPVVVTIPWRPPVCKSCNMFDHIVKSCPKEAKQQITAQVRKPKDIVIKESNDASTSIRKEDVITQVTHVEQSPTCLKETVNVDAILKETGICSSGFTNVKGKKGKTPYINASSDKSPYVNTGSGKKQPIMASFTNKYFMLREELDPTELDDEEMDEEIDTVVDKRIENCDENVWKQIVENAKYSPKKTRVAAKKAVKVWEDLKITKKPKMIPAKGAKKR